MLHYTESKNSYSNPYGSRYSISHDILEERFDFLPLAFLCSTRPPRTAMQPGSGILGFSEVQESCTDFLIIDLSTLRMHTSMS
jgi:hypothetical protein